MIIDWIRVGIVDFHVNDETAEEPWLQLHFNCYDADDNPLPGLGGWLRKPITDRLNAWNQSVLTACQQAEAVATKWVRTFDPYSNEGTLIDVLMVEVKLYQPGVSNAAGINVSFRRGADPVPAAQLFELGPGRQSLRHNQKMTYNDPAMAKEIGTDIDALLRIGHDIAWTINQARSITKYR
ncbi:hypothetical protein CMI37_25485 [Candidatus Pacearchaeota archaeon]|nr:hypothetical protein [Candidatus Pacearchaeota archaeon]|tara:strand:+ start:568 stop:1110 length:543 start_codon:yes stop_codon:yes gene_type:complete